MTFYEKFLILAAKENVWVALLVQVAAHAFFDGNRSRAKEEVRKLISTSVLCDGQILSCENKKILLSSADSWHQVDEAFLRQCSPEKREALKQGILQLGLIGPL